MREELKLRREQLSPPGDDIQETIDALGISQKELAERMGRPKEKVNSMIRGNEPITMKTAIQLERVLGASKGFWLNREQHYREQLAEIEQEEFLESCVEWAQRFPLASMKKLGWLKQIRDKRAVANQLLSFFGVATPGQWHYIYVQAEEVSVAFRASLAHTSEPEALSVWLRKGELDARGLSLPGFRKSDFINCLKDARALAYQQPDDFAQQLKELCYRAGVALVYTPKLPKAPISGATRWVGSNPFIQLTDRYRSNDRFWFTFFHEAGHILKHGKKDIFLEGLDTSNSDETKEAEADHFAADLLIPPNEYKKMACAIRTAEDIVEYSRKVLIHPGIIAGRLQYDQLIDFSQFNNLKVKINLF